MSIYAMTVRTNMDTFKEFYLQRVEDESGVSGTGVVAGGVVFPSDKVVLDWQTFHTSLCIYQNLNDVEAIHGHHGKTLVIMGSPHKEPEPQPKAKTKRKTKADKK